MSKKIWMSSILVGLCLCLAGVAGAMEYKEAPMLADMVKAGDIPPLAERLPDVEDIMVVPVVDSIGQYGGTWNRAFTGIKDFHAWGRINYEPVLRWPRDPKDPIQPGLAKKWEWSEDGTALTLYFRKGMKWSDGAPWTVDDITFWWENIETNKDITAAPHAEWVVAGQPMELEKIDDLTIKLKFAGPNGMAERVGLAFHGNQWPLGFERFGFFAPRHYLELFHPAYNKELTDYTLFEEKAFDYNVERPVMTPWKLSKWEAGGNELILKRNPYYWKVDPEGNQLPYIDRVDFALVENNEAINLLGIAGKIDMQNRRVDLAKYPVYQENAEKGNYHMGMWNTAEFSMVVLFPNQSYPDPKYRELLQNLKFRQAMALAIDRDLINEVSFLGMGEPRGINVVPDSAYHIPELDKHFTDYAPDQAKALLDEIGLAVGDGGVRTFSDGSPLELVIETHFLAGVELDALEIIVENFSAIGLKAALKSMQRDIYWPRACANEVMIGVWQSGRGLTPMVDPIYQFPLDERSWMAPAYGIWYKTEGEQGEEPIPIFKKGMALYDEYRATTDTAKQVELGKEIVRIGTENLFLIQTVGGVTRPVIVKDNFKNVIEEGFTADWLIMAPGTQDPCQYYIEQ
ncbi:MAG: ABC transporter substrate-binding protein [bacterium]|nr:ABC transporter substrate-binding protein [bacterium]